LPVEGCAWDDLYARFCPPERSLAVAPAPGTQAAYEQLGASFEARLKELS
jgi:hypothetical protein